MRATHLEGCATSSVLLVRVTSLTFARSLCGRGSGYEQDRNARGHVRAVGPHRTPGCDKPPRRSAARAGPPGRHPKRMAEHLVEAAGENINSHAGARRHCRGGRPLLVAHRISRAFPPASRRATAASRPTRSTSTPNSPAASPSAASTKGDMVTAGQAVACMDTRDLEASLKKARSAGPSRRSKTRRRGQRQRRPADDSQVTLRAAGDRAHHARSSQQGYGRHGDSSTSASSSSMRRTPRLTAAQGARRRSRACARRRHARRRALQGQYRRQHARRAARRAHPIPHRQCRRGAAGRRQGLHHARHLATSTWTSICRPRRRAGSRSASDARIVLDAYPDRPIPAHVSLPRDAGAIHAEDRRDQDRARQADVPRHACGSIPSVCAPHADAVRTGLPGVAYVRTRPEGRLASQRCRRVASE